MNSATHLFTETSQLDLSREFVVRVSIAPSTLLALEKNAMAGIPSGAPAQGSSLISRYWLKSAAEVERDPMVISHGAELRYCVFVALKRPEQSHTALAGLKTALTKVREKAKVVGG